MPDLKRFAQLIGKFGLWRKSLNEMSELDILNLCQAVELASDRHALPEDLGILKTWAEQNDYPVLNLCMGKCIMSGKESWDRLLRGYSVESVRLAIAAISTAKEVNHDA